MSKLVQRLLVFFIGLPLIIAIVWFNDFHHIALHFVIFLASLLAANELYHLFAQNISLQPRPLVLVMSVLPAFFAVFCVLFELPPYYIDYVFLGAVMVCMAYEVLAQKTFEKSVQHLMSSAFMILYAGFLPTFVSRMTIFEHSREYIAIFILMVCMCDSAAWFFGILFGKNNKGIIKASPNKSIAGFLGGFAGSVLSGIIGWTLFPNLFSGPVFKVVALGIVMAFVSILGDLVESVLKRSAQIKDSGSIIPGRGGILDSVDSIFFAAPVYYIGINLLFNI